MRTRLGNLPPSEFEGMLHPVFQEDDMEGPAANWGTKVNRGGRDRVTELGTRSDRPARSAGRFRDASDIIGGLGPPSDPDEPLTRENETGVGR